MGKVGNGGKGIALEHADRSEAAGRAQRPRHAPRASTRGMPKIETDIDACEVVLHARARDQRPCGGEGMGGAGQADRPRPHAPGASTARTRRSASATSRRSRARSSARRPGAASRARPSRYNAGYTNVHELIPWRTLTGRQQFYHGPPVDARVRRGLLELPPAGGPEDHRRHPRHQAATATPRSCSTSSRRTRSGASTAPTPTTC